MVIIPVENKPDWRRPPLITLLLVLANVWIYFALLGSDEAAYADARHAYVSSGLIEREATLFRRYHDEVLPDPPALLVDYVVLDLGFDAYLAPHLADDPQWRRERASFEQRRDQLSWISMGLVPADPVWWTYLTSMFLHGGVDHLVGNMVFLFIFGFALERVLGSLNYSAVYLLGGLGGGAMHVLMEGGSSVPTIGASGAVSALMGAYLAVYQLRRIRFFYSVLVYFGEFRAPALLVLPLWLAKELYGYLFGEASIAYWAHIGGLLSGAALGLLAMRLSPQVDTDYVEAGSRDVASKASIERLDRLIDDFKYDQARMLAARHLNDYPGDAATWQKYLDLLRGNKDDPEYHKAVRRLLSLAGSRDGAALASLIEGTYRDYAAGSHPQPALRDPRLLANLGEQLARSGSLNDARQIANKLLKANRREAEVARLLRALSSGLSNAGSGALASHYARELSVRFPEAG